MSWQNWLRGLVAAIISGVSNAFLASVVSPETFNASPDGLRKLGTILALSGALGMAMYLKQSPLPTAEEKKTIETTATTTTTTTPAPPVDPPKP